MADSIKESKSQPQSFIDLLQEEPKAEHKENRNESLSNFGQFYEVFHHPESIGGMQGLNMKGELTKFEDSKETHLIEEELAECVKRGDSTQLEFKLIHYTSSSDLSLNEGMKYVLSFYAVNNY